MYSSYIGMRVYIFYMYSSYIGICVCKYGGIIYILYV